MSCTTVLKGCFFSPSKIHICRCIFITLFIINSHTYRVRTRVYVLYMCADKNAIMPFLKISTLPLRLCKHSLLPLSKLQYFYHWSSYRFFLYKLFLLSILLSERDREGGRGRERGREGGGGRERERERGKGVEYLSCATSKQKFHCAGSDRMIVSSTVH